MGIDVSLVEGRLVLIRGYLENLDKLRRLDRDAFLADETAPPVTESYLRRSLEAVFDIGRHILAKLGATDLSMEYKSIAKGLAHKGVVDDRLGEQLVRMARYRGRMVRLYNVVSDEELYEILQAGLGDIRDFSVAVRDFMEKYRAGSSTGR